MTCILGSRSYEYTAVGLDGFVVNSSSDSSQTGLPLVFYFDSCNAFVASEEIIMSPSRTKRAVFEKSKEY